MQTTSSPSATSIHPFFWGVATSGYQSEGGYNGPGQPHNNWALSEQQRKVMPTGTATEFWTRYEEDFQRCETMGVNAFRIGLEWARIQPTTRSQPGPAPEFDWDALDAYADRLAACRRYGLEPIVTLYHFTHPAWLGSDPWVTDDAAIAPWIEYVQTSVTHINRRLSHHHGLDPIRWYITINEPNILVSNTYLSGQFPGAAARGIGSCLRAYDHLLAAHVQAYNRIHDIYEAEGWPSPQVTLNTYCSDLYWSEKLIWDLLSLRQHQVRSQDLKEYVYSNAQQLEAALRQANLPFRRDLPYRLGQLAHWFTNRLGHRTFGESSVQTFLKVLDASPRSQVFDYLAIDYYDPFLAHTFRLPTFSDFEFAPEDFRGWLMSGITSKWWDWRSLPAGLHFFCSFYTQEYQQPLLIAENGMALRRKPDNSIASHRSDQIRRSEFLEVHVQQVERLRHEGVPLLGYLHWSLTDNYEWGSYTPRFGLFSIDFAQSSDRIPEDHLGDCPSETYARLIRQFSQARSRPHS